MENFKLSINMTESMGRGVFSKEKIYALEIIGVYELLELSEEETSKIKETVIAKYTYKLEKTRDCIALGSASMLNHSNDPNVNYLISKIDGRNVLVLSAKKEINPEDQLFIDYSADCEDLDPSFYF